MSCKYIYENIKFVLKINSFCYVCKIQVGGLSLVVRLVVGEGEAAV